jgi:hypothetical protein
MPDAKTLEAYFYVDLSEGLPIIEMDDPEFRLWVQQDDWFPTKDTFKFYKRVDGRMMTRAGTGCELYGYVVSEDGTATLVDDVPATESVYGGEFLHEPFNDHTSGNLFVFEDDPRFADFTSEEESSDEDRNDYFPASFTVDTWNYPAYEYVCDSDSSESDFVLPVSSPWIDYVTSSIPSMTQSSFMQKGELVVDTSSPTAFQQAFDDMITYADVDTLSPEHVQLWASSEKFVIDYRICAFISEERLESNVQKVMSDIDPLVCGMIQKYSSKTIAECNDDIKNLFKKSYFLTLSDLQVLAHLRGPADASFRSQNAPLLGSYFLPGIHVVEVDKIIRRSGCFAYFLVTLGSLFQAFSNYHHSPFMSLFSYSVHSPHVPSRKTLLSEYPAFQSVYSDLEDITYHLPSLVDPLGLIFINMTARNDTFSKVGEPFLLQRHAPCCGVDNVIFRRLCRPESFDYPGYTRFTCQTELVFVPNHLLPYLRGPLSLGYTPKGLVTKRRIPVIFIPPPRSTPDLTDYRLPMELICKIFGSESKTHLLRFLFPLSYRCFKAALSILDNPVYVCDNSVNHYGHNPYGLV